MEFTTLESLAASRREKWLAEHGAHEWEKHDLIQEAMEELADAYNYIEALVADTSFVQEVSGHLRAASTLLAALDRQDKGTEGPADVNSVT